MQSKIELADIVRTFGKEYINKYQPSSSKLKVLFDIISCRTASIGGHKEECDKCNYIRYSYNSCGNRHCPKCLSSKQAIWIDKLINETLPVKHFHIVFTVPHVLNKICLFSKKEYYKILFSSVWFTLQSFGYTHYCSTTGALCVLHTWGQNLSLHPHIHCLVPAAGYSLRGKWKVIGKNQNYLYPVHQLSEAFKGKFLDSIKRYLKKTNKLSAFNSCIQEAYNKPWVVYSEASMANTEHVIRYLGMYTHRVAISNDRLLEIKNEKVFFSLKDYADNGKKKIIALSGVEFLHRFCLHVLPKHFVKIRRFGIYNATTKRNLNLQFVVQLSPVEKQLKGIAINESTAEKIIRLTGFDVGKCTKCKDGRMHVIRELPRIRSPCKAIQNLVFDLII